MQMKKSVILTGIRSNQEPTLGNYLGAIAPMVEMANKKADDFQINMFVPDLHSFTTPVDHKKLYNNTLRNVKLFAAAGLPINHENVFIYRQSFVPAHSELAWILSCFTSYGEASRMVEFKDKSKQLGEQQVSAGLFNYPILMAADILLYDAEWVPVGEDQRQHLELVRNLAERMNNKFGNIFVIPKDLNLQQKFINRESAPRIRSLRNPDKKMSKSVNDPNGTILLSDNPQEAAKKIMSATTDSVAKIQVDWTKQPGISNLIQISSFLTSKPTNEIVENWKGKTSYGDFKNDVAMQVTTFLTEFQSQLAKVDETKLMLKLQSDENAMNEVANKTLLKVQRAVGLRPA